MKKKNNSIAIVSNIEDFEIEYNCNVLKQKLSEAKRKLKLLSICMK